MAIRDTAGLDRRELLQRGVLAGVGFVLSPLAALAAPEPPPRTTDAPSVRAYRTLGRTGLRVSDIGFGSSALAGDEQVVLHALDRGITYFDTADNYKGGRAEVTLGRALRGRRDQVVLGSKVECGPDYDRDDLMQTLDGSLKRLQTDHVDLYFNHAVNSVTHLQNEEWQEFASRAKQAGKIRFTGMSGHGGRLVECLDYALAHDLFDVFLVAYNFGQDPGFVATLTRDLDVVAVNQALPGALAQAKQKGVGVIAMKTLRGARLNDMRPYETEGSTFAQAAFRWVLNSPNVDSLIVSMKSTTLIDEYLGASGTAPPKAADVRLLERYEASNGRSQCRYGCSGCSEACPAGVPIADLLRVRMYAEDYRDLELARQQHATLGVSSSVCVSCAHRACATACPYGLDISSLTIRAERAVSG